MSPPSPAANLTSSSGVLAFGSNIIDPLFTVYPSISFPSVSTTNPSGATERPSTTIPSGPLTVPSGSTVFPSGT